MADTTTTSTRVLDPNLPYTPEEYAGVKQTQYESEYPTFDSNIDRFRPQAESELRPYYQGLFDQLGIIEKGTVDKANKTYSDVVASLQDQYNQRGRFFGGGAIKAEGVAATDQINNLDAITADFATRRASAASEMTSKSLERAAELQQSAYNDYKVNKEQAVNKKVGEALTEYIPKYAAALQAQLADENNPWLEIPLEEGVDIPAETAATTTPATAPAATNDGTYRIHSVKTWQAVGNQFDKSEYTNDKKNGLRLTAAAYKNRYVGLSNLKKYKANEMFKIGNDYFLKKGVKKR